MLFVPNILYLSLLIFTYLYLSLPIFTYLYLFRNTYLKFPWILFHLVPRANGSKELTLARMCTSSNHLCFRSRFGGGFGGAGAASGGTTPDTMASLGCGNMWSNYCVRDSWSMISMVVRLSSGENWWVIPRPRKKLLWSLHVASPLTTSRSKRAPTFNAADQAESCDVIPTQLDHLDYPLVI